MSGRGRKLLNDIGLELTPGEIARLDNLADPAARISDAQAARLLASSVVRTAELRWSPELVKLRLRQAIEGIERYVTRPGPSQKTGYWPTTAVEFADRVAMLTTGELARFYESRTPRDGGLSEIEISRVEQAIHWPAHYLGSDEYDDERMALQTWMWCEARNEAFGRFGAAQSGSRSTAYRRRDRAIDIILAGLLNDGVLP